MGIGQGMSMGPGGFCICPRCGYKKAHEPGIPCREEKCPNCGTRLIREGSPCYKGIMERKQSGRIVPAWQIYRYGAPPAPTEEELKAELISLKEKKAGLEKRIEEIEKQIKEKGGSA